MLVLPFSLVEETRRSVDAVIADRTAYDVYGIAADR